MSDTEAPAVEKQDEPVEERIPRKVRDLIGRMNSRVEKLEARLAEATAAGNAPSEEPAPPARRQDPGHAPAAGRRRPEDPRLALEEELRRIAGLAGLPPELFAGLAEQAAAPEDAGDGWNAEPDAAPAGASTTPSAPPPEEDPGRSAVRRAESVEARLDERYFGSE